MSSSTRIWPSHFTLAPMPMVGIGTALVILAASGSTMPSSTTAKAPASATIRASSSCSAQLSSSRPWVLKPPITWLDCGVRPVCAITGMPRSVRKWIVSAIRLPPSSLTAPQPVSFITGRGVAEGDVGAFLVGAERHVDDDQRLAWCRAPPRGRA